MKAEIETTGAQLAQRTRTSDYPAWQRQAHTILDQIEADGIASEHLPLLGQVIHQAGTTIWSFWVRMPRGCPGIRAFGLLNELQDLPEILQISIHALAYKDRKLSDEAKRLLLKLGPAVVSAYPDMVVFPKRADAGKSRRLNGQFHRKSGLKF